MKLFNLQISGPKFGPCMLYLLWHFQFLVFFCHRELHVNEIETIAANVFYEIPELLHL